MSTLFGSGSHLVILNFAKGSHAGTESDRARRRSLSELEVDRDIAEAKALS